MASYSTSEDSNVVIKKETTEKHTLPEALEEMELANIKLSNCRSHLDQNKFSMTSYNTSEDNKEAIKKESTGKRTLPEALRGLEVAYIKPSNFTSHFDKTKINTISYNTSEDSKDVIKKETTVKRTLQEALGELGVANMKLSNAFYTISSALVEDREQEIGNKEIFNKCKNQILNTLDFLRVQTDAIEEKLTNV